MNREEFEQHVIDALARLETNMHDLVGNGQPGRIDKLESNMLKVMIGLAILAALALGPQAIALFK